MDIKIYIAAHKAFHNIAEEDIYIPLQVGREGKEDFGYVTDHTGQNISDRNANYCELTGLYWMWKNSSCDIIGLCHYRRYLEHDGQILTGNYIEEQMLNYDIILPNSSMSRHANEYEHYCEKHMSKDLECCLEVVRERAPEYETAFLWTLSSNLISLGNIMITRKQILDDYCAWLFDILFEVEQRTDLSGYDDYQKRIYGFLSERLLRTWVIMQKYRVLEENIKCI